MVPSPHVIHGLYRRNNGREWLEGATYVYLCRSQRGQNVQTVRAFILTSLILAGIILDEVERTETENKPRKSEKFPILFAKENEIYQSLHCINWKTMVTHQSCWSNIFACLLS
jgi:hypothetical protein